MTQDMQDTTEKEVNAQQQISEEELKKMSYEDYLQLVHPELSLEEIQKMIRKERRYVWIGRFEILALIVFFCLIIFFIVTK